MPRARQARAPSAPWSRCAAAAVILCAVSTSMAASTYADDATASTPQYPAPASGGPSTRAPTSAPSWFDINNGSINFCADTVCLEPDACDDNVDCGAFQDCDRGTCACRYSLPEDSLCAEYNKPGTSSRYDCKTEVCSTVPTYTSMSDLIPLALTIGVCFVVAVTAMLACKMLIKRMYSGGPVTRFSDGDADSVSSMQRWINERLRDRPPRYEEMVSETSSASTRAARTAAPASPQDAAPATISAAVAEAEEKPPAYEVAVDENQQSAGIYYQGPVADNIPPPLYSAEAMAVDAADGRRCYRNPCFLGDAEAPPPYSTHPVAVAAARSTRSVSLPDPFVESLFDPFEPPPASAASRFTAPSPSASSASLASTPPSSPTSSMASFASASSSSFPPTPGDDARAAVDLLTVSQAVALKEMLLAEGVPEAAGGGGGVESPVLWTSTC